MADDKPPKLQRKLISTFWKYYEFLQPNKDGTMFYKCKRMWPSLP